MLSNLLKYSAGIAAILLTLLTTANGQHRQVSSQPRQASLAAEARRVATDFWNQHVIRCGNSYWMFTNIYMMHELKDSPIITVNGDVQKPKTLSRADVLNGVDPLPVEWVGTTTVHFEAARRYQEGRFGQWSNAESTWTYSFQRAKGQWQFQSGIPLPISCSNVPGGISSARPTVSSRFASYLVLEVKTSGEDHNVAVNETIDIIRKRLDLIGVSVYKVERENNSTSNIALYLPPLREPERIKTLLISPGRFEIVHVISPPAPSGLRIYQTKDEAVHAVVELASPSFRLMPYTEVAESISENGQRSSHPLSEWAIVDSKTIVDTNDLSQCHTTRLSSGNNQFGVSCSLKAFGSEALLRWTAANINQYVGISVNGELKSIAFIKTPVRDSISLSGPFSKDMADDLVASFSSGALPAQVVFLTERIIR